MFRPLRATQDVRLAQPPGSGISRWTNRAIRKSARCIGGLPSRARFGEREPAPILVNTSFNLPGEPPVVRPRDAVRTFFCSGTDAVFIDNFLLTKWNSAYILNGRSVQKQGVQGTV